MTRQRPFDELLETWLDEGPEAAPRDLLESVLVSLPTRRQRRRPFAMRFSVRAGSSDAAATGTRVTHLTRSLRAIRAPSGSSGMNETNRLLAMVGAVALIAVLVVGGATILSGPKATGPGGPPAPSATTAPTDVSTPTASAGAHAGSTSTTFTSTMNGFSVVIPADWTKTAASKPWSSDTPPIWGAPELDDLHGPTARLVGTSQPIAPFTSGDAWIQARLAQSPSCPASATGLQHADVGDLASGYLGTVDLNDCSTDRSHGSIVDNGQLFDVLVVAGGRGYDLTMDGDVTYDAFRAMLRTVTLEPATAFAATPWPLTKTFSSPWYGYSISYADGWQAAPATSHWAGWDNSAPAVDVLTPAATDSSVAIGSQALASGTTSAQWLADYHSHVTPQVPTGCDGGDPATWPSVAVGSQVGHLEQLCNAAEVVTEVGGRIYVFSWMNTTFTASSHFDQDAFISMLKTVIFEPSAAVN